MDLPNSDPSGGTTVQESYPVVENKLSVGFQRWGRYAGCGFLNQSPEKWPSKYTCDNDGEYLCSTDNRMGARCATVKWDSVS